MTYVDGFVVPVPKHNLERYFALSRTMGAIWREYGALEYREALADDVNVGEVTSFPRSVQLAPDEVVVFAWITYESRAKRDEVNAKVMSDPRLKGQDPASMPFDAKRMIFGGFEVRVDV
jgi:uncharacterized protein YbaA (DUF1428 family)